MHMVRYAWLLVVLVIFPILGCASSARSISVVSAGSSAPVDIAGNAMTMSRTT